MIINLYWLCFQLSISQPLLHSHPVLVVMVVYRQRLDFGLGGSLLWSKSPPSAYSHIRMHYFDQTFGFETPKCDYIRNANYAQGLWRRC